MQRGVAIDILGEELGPNIANGISKRFRESVFDGICLLYEVPGGNLVDGLPPAASTRAGA